MLRAIKTELVKYFTTRMWWTMAIGIVASAALLTGGLGALVTMNSTPPRADEPGGAWTSLALAKWTYGIGAPMGYVLLLVVGIMLVGQEYRHKTISTTFLSFPRRARLMGAKLVAMMLIGGFYGLVYAVSAFVAGALALAAGGWDVLPDAGAILALFGRVLVVLGLWGLIGIGVGILIPNQLVAILLSLAVVFVVEPIVSSIGFMVDIESLRVLGRYLPQNCANGALGSGSLFTGPLELVAGSPFVPAWAGMLTLACWGLASALLGSWLTTRRDIS